MKTRHLSRLFLGFAQAYAGCTRQRRYSGPGRRSPFPIRFARGERGQAMAEFALLLPMLLVIIFAIAEFGFALTDQLAVTDAARDAVRTYALKGGTSAAAITQAQNDLTSSSLISCSANTPTTSTSSPNVSITVTCTYTPVTPLAAVVHLMGGSVGTINISASATMRQEQ